MSSHVKTVVIMVGFPCPPNWTQIVGQQSVLAYKVVNHTCYARLKAENEVDWACKELEKKGVLLAGRTTVILMERHGNRGRQIREGEEWKRHSYNYVKRTPGGWAVGSGVSDTDAKNVGEKAETFLSESRKGRGG